MRSTLFLVSLVLFGCNSTYLPSGPRISVVLHQGSPAFARDGKLVEPGFFGGGLVEVVEGNPRAEEQAEAYRDLSTTSFGLLMGGLGTVAVSPFILLGGLASSSNDVPSDGVFVASLSTSVVGLGLVLAGLAVELSAQPKLYDAINLFNSEIDAREAATRPRPPPPPQEFVAPLPAIPVAPPPDAPLPDAPPPDAPPPEPAPAPPPEPFGPRR